MRDDAVGDVVVVLVHLRRVDRPAVWLDIYRPDGRPVYRRPPVWHRHGHRPGQQVARPDQQGDPAAMLVSGLAAGDERMEDAPVMVGQGSMRRAFQAVGIEVLVDAPDHRPGNVSKGLLTSHRQ